jgi:aspartate/methionine/tyrosine aminotransferase
MCDTSRFDPDGDDVAFCDRLVRELGVAAVPGSSFYTNRELGRRKVRFAFPKRLETLQLAADRLAGLATWR